MSGASAKAKGTRIERRVMKMLEATGHSVHRAPASLGCFDVFAWMPNGIMRAIQVKGGKHPYCCPAEREAMQLEPLPAGATRELWLVEDYCRTPVVKMLEGR